MKTYTTTAGRPAIAPMMVQAEEAFDSITALIFALSQVADDNDLPDGSRGAIVALCRKIQSEAEHGATLLNTVRTTAGGVA